MGYVLQRDQGKRLVWALGSLVNARATTDETGGAFELLEYTAAMRHLFTPTPKRPNRSMSSRESSPCWSVETR